MKKVILGLSIALLAIGAVGCKKNVKSRTVTANNTAQAVSVAETITKIEAKIQINDAKAADANTALTCKYVVVNGSSISRAEMKTSGKCDFNTLAGQATGAGTLDAGAASQIISLISADSTLPASVKPKWDCKAINVVTNTRKVGVQDCVNGQGVSDATGKSIAGILGL